MAGTIKQIAELAGVSRGTVDRALNHRGRVNPEVARHIEQIAEEIGYLTKTERRSGSVSRTAQAGPLFRIGVITQLAASAFMLEVHRGIADVSRKLARQGIEVELRESATVDAAEQLRLIDSLSPAVDALAIMPVDSDEVRTKLSSLAIPVMTFNTDIAGAGRLAFVGLDNTKSGRAAAGLLAMLMRGSGRVLGITGSFSNSASSHRMDGFAEELTKSFPGMELVGVQSSFDRAVDVERIVSSALMAYPDLGGILIVSGGQEGVRQALAKQPAGQRPFVIMYDLTPANLESLRDNFADFIIDQDGYTQGYRCVSLLADKLRWNKDPEAEYLYTHINILTKYTAAI